ncbi:MAG: alpha/beta hydrolase, partial [Acidobacteria bacterium]|nr:alpha/beta hydrolase [Acidobacteriota bacterium]
DELQRLDVYTPAQQADDASARPVMVYVHGGGWVSGDKSRIGSKPDWLLEQGFLLVSVNYRLSPQARHPTHTRDLAAALAWVAAHIADYGGDPEAIFLMGHSSGGHLVSLVATDERFLAAHQLTPDLVKGVIAVDTNALDIEALVRSRPPAETRLYRLTFGARPAGWRDASPSRHLAAGKPIPPFLLLVAGAGDSTHRQAVAFARLLRSTGHAGSVEVFPDQTHGSINLGLGRTDHAPTRAVERFLRDRFARTSEPGS